MASNNRTQFTKDFANNKMVVTHQCDADIDTVWDMWTKPELLDLWWAPKPWRSETRSMEFKNGGRRFYAMVGPNNEHHWCIGDFNNINPKKTFDVKDAFTDENQVINKEMPSTEWRMNFGKDGDGVRVTVTLLGPGTQLKRLIEMGFEEGFTMALGNLDEELAAHAAKK